jgi:hypothetical protein
MENKLFCKCLHEIENDLDRTKWCMMPCLAQITILKEREELQKEYPPFSGPYPQDYNNRAEKLDNKEQ